METSSYLTAEPRLMSSNKRQAMEHLPFAAEPRLMSSNKRQAMEHLPFAAGLA